MTEDQALSSLGLPAGTPLKEVRLRYRKLALDHHPDQGGSEAVWLRIVEAYKLLSGPNPAVAEGAKLRARMELARVRQRIRCVESRIVCMRPDDERIPWMMDPLKDEEKRLIEAIGAIGAM